MKKSIGGCIVTSAVVQPGRYSCNKLSIVRIKMRRSKRKFRSLELIIITISRGISRSGLIKGSKKFPHFLEMFLKRNKRKMFRQISQMFPLFQIKIDDDDDYI